MASSFENQVEQKVMFLAILQRIKWNACRVSNDEQGRFFDSIFYSYLVEFNSLLDFILTRSLSSLLSTNSPERARCTCRKAIKHSRPICQLRVLTVISKMIKTERFY